MTKLNQRLEVELFGIETLDQEIDSELLIQLCRLAAASAGVVGESHVAVSFVDADEIQRLNAQYRLIDRPTDVLSFPIDEDGEATYGPRELGDVVICPEHTEDIPEATLHGVLHLVGMDHETDQGQMLALQAEIMSWLDRLQASSV